MILSTIGEALAEVVPTGGGPARLLLFVISLAVASVFAAALRVWNNITREVHQ